MRIFLCFLVCLVCSTAEAGRFRARFFGCIGAACSQQETETIIINETVTYSEPVIVEPIITNETITYSEPTLASPNFIRSRPVRRPVRSIMQLPKQLCVKGH